MGIPHLEKKENVFFIAEPKAKVSSDKTNRNILYVEISCCGMYELWKLNP